MTRRVIPRVIKNAHAPASSSAAIVAMMIRRLPPAAVVTAALAAASLKVSDWTSTAWFFSRKASNAGSVERVRLACAASTSPARTSSTVRAMDA